MYKIEIKHNNNVKNVYLGIYLKEMNVFKEIYHIVIHMILMINVIYVLINII